MAANSLQLKTALQKPYDRVLFAQDVLSPVFGNGFSLYSNLVLAPVQPNNTEKKVVDTVSIYGNIVLEDGTEITCYEIVLQPQVRIEQSKVAIQRYVRKLLTAGQAALVNFVTPLNKNVWRLTLVAKDSVLTNDGIKEKTTQAKRYTYILGVKETCKTPAERFEKLSTEREINFQALVDAFSVEKLSKAFFDEYTLHYEKFIDHLNSSNFKKSVFNGEEKAIRDFTKKLLGRIVFLYFVQKKGWLGATTTKYIDGKPDFINTLFHQAGGDEAFYSQWLTILFFETLNKERENDDFMMPDGSTVKVPFLNGGLFDKEAHDDYQLTFSPKLFHSNDFTDTPLDKKTHNNHRGFLDFLDAFNFTVHEDSPDEHTIAVDPEMLGHIFENLLEYNRETGTYYTPKEVVHYMCQESLIEYLATHLSKEYTVYKELGNAQVEFFGNDAKRGQLKMVEEMGDKALNRDDVARIVKTKDISGLTAEQLNRIDQLLNTVKICDPAIGSGAFPMGLLQEIFSIKEAIAYELQTEWKPAEVKENIIQNSIYGVDIEKGAVDIARLRFWLSLVVDEDKPRALPNLDYKIVVGDSLVSKFNGQVVEIDWEKKRTVDSADHLVQNIQRLLKEIAAKQKSFFEPTTKNKAKLRTEIRNLKLELLINQLTYNKQHFANNYTDKGGFAPSLKDIKYNTELKLTRQNFDNQIAQLQTLLKNEDKPFEHFDWRLDFPEILNPTLISNKEKIGFDIVIGNPPYIKEFTNKTAFDGLRNSPYYQGKMDLWYLFACKFIDLIKSQIGILTFIATNNWVTNSGASKFRNKVTCDAKILQLIDFGNYKIFDRAGIQTMIMIFKSDSTSPKYTFDYRKIVEAEITLSDVIGILNKDDSDKFQILEPEFNREYFKGKSFTFTTDNVDKILNTIFNIANFQLDEKEDVAQGIVTPQDNLNKAALNVLGEGFKLGQGIFNISNEEIANLNLTDKEKSLIKPFYTTDELGRYYGNKKNKHWVIYTDSSFKNPESIKPYPNIKAHLDKFQKVITSDNKPYGLHRSRDEYFFKGEKIVSVRKCSIPTFTYTDFDCYVSQTFYVIKTNRINQKYLTALLNSKLIAFWLRNKGKMQGFQYQIDKEPILDIPIFKIDDTSVFETVVDYILFLKSQKLETTTDQLMPVYFEQVIDGMVYELYFPELLKQHNREIIKHLGELPDFTDKKSDTEKMAICKQVFNRLNEREHPVRVNLFYMDSIPEIRIIEGKDNPN